MSETKLLILTERFYPEEFLINDLAVEWKRCGHQVEVLTQVPSYPHDKIYDGYTNRPCFQTTHGPEEIPVHRVKTLLGYNQSVVRKICNYLRFALLTLWWALVHGRRYDRIFVYHTAALTMASAALVFRFIYRKPVMIWTQDVWPDTVYAYGFKPTWWKRVLLNTFVKTIYSACSTVSVSSPSFIQKLAPFTRKTVHFIPQWTTQEHPILPRVPSEKRVFTFAGNIGSVQNLEMLVEAFGKLAPENAELRIVGGGVMLEPLREAVSANGWKNISLPGRFPQSQMPQLFAESDILIISLKAEFAMTLPAKFQAYIAAGKPLFGIIGGDTADLIEKHHIGIAVSPELEAIQEGIRQFLNTPAEQLTAWGNNARDLSERDFKRSAIITRMTNLLFESK